MEQSQSGSDFGIYVRQAAKKLRCDWKSQRGEMPLLKQMKQFFVFYKGRNYFLLERAKGYYGGTMIWIIAIRIKGTGADVLHNETFPMRFEKRRWKIFYIKKIKHGLIFTKWNGLFNYKWAEDYDGTRRSIGIGDRRRAEGIVLWLRRLGWSDLAVSRRIGWWDRRCRSKSGVGHQEESIRGADLKIPIVSRPSDSLSDRRSRFCWAGFNRKRLVIVASEFFAMG